MRVDSAVVGMTGDQNISEKEKNVQAKKKHFHKHLTKKCNKQQTMNDAPRRLAKCTFPDFFPFTSHSALEFVLCLPLKSRFQIDI